MKEKRIGLYLSLLVSVTFLSGCEQHRLDQQVKELCAKDGGIKVYETVTLPSENFDQWGNVKINIKKYSKPDDAYYLEMDTQFLRKGNPTLVRMVARAVRNSDGKVLGESVRYGRGGGDIPGPWHPSSYTCPEISQSQPSLESSVFLKGNAK